MGELSVQAQQQRVAELQANIKAAKASGDDATVQKNLAELNQLITPAEQPKTDEAKIAKKEPTPEDVEAQANAAKNNKKAVDKNANDKYAGAVAVKLYQDPNKNKNALAQLAQMNAAANKGNYKEAAAKYKMLQQSGALDGIEMDPPYLDQMKSELAKIDEQKGDVERARNAVNSNDGVDRMIEYYKAHDTKKELHEAYDAKLAATGGLHDAGKTARENRKNLKALEEQRALEDSGVIVGDKKAYKAARKNAENKNTVSYMSEGGMEVAKKINESLIKQGKPTILKEDGSINVDAAQEYARQRVSTAGDRADKNEIESLAKELGVSKKDVKAFFKGINVDYQKNYTIPGIAAGVVAGAATLLNPLAGGTVGAVAAGTNTITSMGHTNTTINNNTETSYLPDGKGGLQESVKNTSVTTVETTPGETTTEEIPGSKGHRRLGFNDFLAAAGTGVAVEELVRKVVNHDPQILKKNKTIANVLTDDASKVVKKKGNQDKVRLIQGYDLTAKGYDKDTADQIKLALLSDAMGEGGKLNSRELNGVLAQLEAVPNKPKTQTPQPNPGDGDNNHPDNDNNSHPANDNNTPIVTERTVLDIGGDGFFDPNANDGKGDFLKDTNGKNIAQIGDGDGAVGLKGSIGHARDWEKLRQRGAQTEGNDVNAKAQYVIADEKGETAVTPDSTLSGVAAYEAPSEIKLRDNTNGKDNTYQYKKLSAEDAKKYVPADAGDGPFYILDSAYDANRQLKAKNIEVYRLELEPEEKVVEETDDKGNVTKTKVRRFKYNLEQYKGYTGSKQTSMFWNHRAR